MEDPRTERSEQSIGALSGEVITEIADPTEEELQALHPDVRQERETKEPWNLPFPVYPERAREETTQTAVVWGVSYNRADLVELVEDYATHSSVDLGESLSGHVNHRADLLTRFPNLRQDNMGPGAQELEKAEIHIKIIKAVAWRLPRGARTTFDVDESGKLKSNLTPAQIIEIVTEIEIQLGRSRHPATKAPIAEMRDAPAPAVTPPLEPGTAGAKVAPVTASRPKLEEALAEIEKLGADAKQHQKFRIVTLYCQYLDELQQLKAARGRKAGNIRERPTLKQEFPWFNVWKVMEAEDVDRIEKISKKELIPSRWALILACRHECRTALTPRSIKNYRKALKKAQLAL